MRKKTSGNLKQSDVAHLYHLTGLLLLRVTASHPCHPTDNYKLSGVQAVQISPRYLGVP